MMPDTIVQADLQSAVAFHQSGELKKAERIYLRILDVDPENADVLHLLGLVSHQFGKSRVAVTLVKRALEIVPDQLNYLWNLANIFRESDEFHQAVDTYHYIIQLRPRSASAYYELGVTLQNFGQLQQAVLAYQKAIDIHPDDSQMYVRLAIVLLKLKKFGKAIRACQRAIQISSENFLAYNILGNVYKELSRFEESIRAYRQVLRIQPKLAEAYSNLGDVFQESNRFDEAIQAYLQAIEIKPEIAQVYANLGFVFSRKLAELEDVLDSPKIRKDNLELHDQADDFPKVSSYLEKVIQYYQQALEINPEYSANVCNNLGVAYAKGRRFKEAIQQYNKAIGIDAEYGDAYGNLGQALHTEKRPEEAISAYQKAIGISSERAEYHQGYGDSLLLTGNWQRGWKEYEWRWKCDRFLEGNERKFPHPTWDGSSLEHTSILVWLEQGVGDQIMFASLLPKLQKQAKQTFVEIEYRLYPIFRRSFHNIRFFIAKTRPHPQLLDESVGCQSSIGSLAQWLLPDEGSFPKCHAYFKACPKKTEKIKREYQKLANGRILVGISWKSTKANKGVGRLKSTSLAQWTNLLSQEDCFFVNLQYGDVESELDEFSNQTGILIYQDPQVDSLQDLDGFAAQVAALDLIISTSNTAVHMAGALGKPVWTLLHDVPDWRWQLDRSDALWYSSMTLFRQSVSGDWESVFEQVQSALKRFVEEKLNKNPKEDFSY